uniref:F-box domain-containing protein n=1 Tax=Aegilops tauschii TaxID=37682 RepID=R7VYH7_AEGTA
MTPPPWLRPWADLHADYFLRIVDRVPSLRDYVSVRAVCTAWRSALPPVRQSPSLRVLDDFQPHDGPPRDNSHVYALSILRQRTFRLATLPYHSSRIIGCSNSYLAIADGCRLGALNPVTGEEIELLDLPSNLWPRRVMLGPNPRPGCYTSVAICDHNYVT